MVNSQKEIARLKDWELVVASHINEISNNKKYNQLIFYSISSVSSDYKIDPYTTPVRISGDKIVAGVIVGSQIEALITSNYIEDLVDYLLLDVEKKIPIQKIPNDDIFLAFNLKKSLYIANSKTVSGVEFGNISSAVRKTFPTEKIINYKPNDLTVESIWFFLSHKYKNFADFKVAIIGTGNIGFKLALKLVESGTFVNLNRRDHILGSQLANTINSIKPRNTIAEAKFYADPVRACTLCDVIIGTGKSNSLIVTETMVNVMMENGILIDCGKGNITEKAINYAYNLGLNVYRGDVTSGIISFVEQADVIKNTLNNKTGRKLIKNNIFIISGGVYGKLEDIVVDNYDYPNVVYGMADGRGQILINLTEAQSRKINYVLKHFDINQPSTRVL